VWALAIVWVCCVLVQVVRLRKGSLGLIPRLRFGICFTNISTAYGSVSTFYILWAEEFAKDKQTIEIEKWQKKC
jgi:hypothetical protein